jgi:hypothetical protein
MDLGVAFAELLFPNLVAQGVGMRRLLVDVYRCDVALIAEYAPRRTHTSVVVVCGLRLRALLGLYPPWRRVEVRELAGTSG